MATLDSFFMKRAQPTRALVTGDHTTSSGKGIETDTQTDSSSKCPTKISPEKQRHKRSLDGCNSSDHLKVRKKHKIVVDSEVTMESKVLKRTENNLELSDAVTENVSEAAEVLEPKEISYEDFLAANRAACIRVDDKGTDGNSGDVGLEISVSVVDDQLSGSVVEKACESNDTVDLQEACKVEEPVSTVLSKDIRNFFSKATATTTLLNDKKLSATHVKVKAEVHHEPKKQIAVSSAKPSTTNNRHVDLARWQRANIVITNADLDIEILSVCDAAVMDSSSEIKDANVAALDKMPSATLPITKSIIHEDVSVPVDEKTLRDSVGHNIGTDSSVRKCLTENNNKLHVTKKNKSKTFSSLNVDDDNSIQIVCDKSDSSTDATIIEVIEINEEKCCGPSTLLRQGHQKLLNLQEPNSSTETQSNEPDAVTKKTGRTEVNSSGDKLADIFTPRSRRNVPAEEPSTVSNDIKSTGEDDAKSTRRHSSRLSAKAALDAISRSVEILQNTPKIRSKKSPVDDDDTDLDVEFVDLETQPKEVKGKCVDSKTVSSGKGAKLAPIFEKQSAVKAKKSPVLSAAEIEARRIRREFLISGVPEELKRQQEVSQALAFCPTPAVWPKDSHVQQIPSGHQQNVNPWNLDEAKLPLRPCSNLNETPKVTGHGFLLPGVIAAIADQSTSSQKFQTHEDLSQELKSLLLNEVRSHNRQFPVGRFYSQLMTKQNVVEPLMKITTNDAPPSKKQRPGSAEIQQIDGQGGKEVEQEDLSDGDSLLWTDKYAPRCATEIIGNWSASKKLRDWLTLWKERITRVAEKSAHKGSQGHQKMTTVDDNVNNDSDFDYSIESYDSDDLNSGDSYLCNAMVLYGPHGIGKTALVYAMASELGFKIFEVNSSGQRDGKHVLTQLQEATQSHQVSRAQTVSANLTDNERMLSSASSSVSEPENVKHSNNTKLRAQKKSHGSKTKSKEEARPFASLFAKANLTSSNTKKQGQTKEESKRKASKNVISKIDHVSSSKKSDVKTSSVAKKETSKKTVAKTVPDKNGAKPRNSDEKVVSAAETIQKSLILFEEVDVVLEDDRGFWNAIETFMHTTKRPIILTASDSQFISRFTGRVESIKLHTPQLINTATYLQMICIVENVRTSFSDLLSLVSLTQGDIRQALLQLQCWVQTGASGSQRISAPIYACVDVAEEGKTEDVSGSSFQQTVAPKVAPFVSKTRDCIKQITADIDGDEDFATIRKSNKKRRLQRFPSSEDDSQSSTVIVDDSSNVNVDDGSQESCSQTACSFDVAVPFLPTVALDQEKAPHVHQVDVNFVGGCNIQRSLIVQGEALHQAKWLGDCWWPTLPIFDTVVQDQSMFEVASSDCDQPSSRFMYALYDHYSFVDCCYSQRYCTELADSTHLLPGNTDCLPCNDFRNLSLKRRLEMDEMRSVLDELVHKATDKWHPNKRTTDDGERARCLRQDVAKYEKLALDVRVAGDYVLSRHLGLQRQALSLDYLPSLRAMAKSESIRQVTNGKRRFYHHLKTSFPDLKPSVINHLCTAFT